MATQDDLMQLRSEMNAVQQAALRARKDTADATARIERTQREHDDEQALALQRITQRLDTLTASVTALSSRLDELSARADAAARAPRPATPPPTARPLSPPPASATAPAPSTPAPSAPPPASQPPVASRAPTPALQPQDLYQAAYIDYSKGSYVLAIAGFREFLRRFPEHPLGGAAQYWVGESHLSLARGYANAAQADKVTEALEQAVQEFRKVLANYPRSDKAPTALYKEAIALIELKQPQAAQSRLQYLVDTFPQAEEAPLARERLAALRSR